MEEIMREEKAGMTCLLTFNELKVLLTSLGYDRCEGVYMPPEQYTDEEVARIVAKLVKRGFLTAGETSFSMRPDVEEMVRVIGEPSVSSVIETRDGGPSYYMYSSPERIVVTEKMADRADTLRIRSFTPAEYAEFMEEIL